MAATLDSVLAQTFGDWECIVVDDGSPDEVAAIAQGYVARDPRFRLLRQKNAGVAAARNAGYACAYPSVEYVIFQDSDDTWEPDALALLAAALDAHPDAAGAHGLAERIGPDGEPLPDRHAELMRERLGYAGRLTPLRPDQPATLDCLVTKFKLYPPGLVLLRRPLIARAGLWTEERALAPSADWDMFTRVCRYGPILFVDRVIAGYRKHETQHDRPPRPGALAAPPGHPAPPRRQPRDTPGAGTPGAPGRAGLRGRPSPPVSGRRC